MYENQTYNPYAQNIAIIKEYFKKPLVLVIGILYIASVILTLITAMSMGSGIGDMYNTLFNYSGIYSDMTAEEAQIFQMFTNSGFMSAFMLICMIPSVIMIGLYVLAYFLIYFKSKNPDPNASPKAGVVILFVMSIISLVSAIFATLIFALYVILCVIFGVVFMTDPSMAGDGGAVAGIVFIVLALVMAGIGAIMLIYSISNFNFCNSVRKSLTTVKLYNKGAGVFGVLSIIYGAISILSAITTVFVGPLMSLMMNMIPTSELDGFPVEMFSSLGSMYTFSGVSALVSSLILILTGTLAIGYKNHINKYTNAFAGEPLQEAPMEFSPNAQPDVPQPVFTQPEVTQENAADSQGTCPQCGSVCDENAVFCNNCGTRIK